MEVDHLEYDYNSLNSIRNERHTVSLSLDFDKIPFSWDRDVKCAMVDIYLLNRLVIGVFCRSW